MESKRNYGIQYRRVFGGLLYGIRRPDLVISNTDKKVGINTDEDGVFCDKEGIMKARDRFTLEREIGRRNRPISSYLIQMREGKRADEWWVRDSSYYQIQMRDCQRDAQTRGKKLIVSNTDEHEWKITDSSYQIYR